MAHKSKKEKTVDNDTEPIPLPPGGESPDGAIQDAELPSAEKKVSHQDRFPTEKHEL